MNTTQAADQRREFRFLLNGKLDIIVSASEQFTGICHNISGSGLLIISPKALTVGQSIRVELSQRRVEFSADAAVIRCEKINDAYHIGVEITELHS